MCVHEFTLDDKRDGPLHPVLFALGMLVESAGGQAYTRGKISAMLQKAGARDITTLPIELPNGCQVSIGKR